MPSLTPISGLSLITHIVINIVAFIWRNIKKFLNKIDIHPKAEKSNFFLISKEGDIWVRKFLAYIVIISVFVTVGSAGFTVVRLFLTIDDSSYTHNISLVSLKKDENKSGVVDNKLTYDYNVKPITKTEVEGVYAYKDLNINDNNISLSDKLKTFGVENPTFQFKSELAAKLDVVNDKSLYNGSEKQNLLIAKRISQNPTFAKQVIEKLKSEDIK
jgi:hypothetical protein